MSSRKTSLQISDLTDAETLGVLDTALENASTRRNVAMKEAGLIVGGANISVGGFPNPFPDPFPGTCGMVCPETFPSIKER